VAIKRVIIDTNVVHEVLLPSGREQFSDLRAALLTGAKFTVVAIWGGKLREEYLKVAKSRRTFVLLNQSGRLKREDDGAVSLETKVLEKRGICRSNDQHVLALAKVGKARVLCSLDDLLCGDFTTKAIIDNPRGHIYRNKDHNHLLR
jgi:predicted nucleic acid-binding protein